MKRLRFLFMGFLVLGVLALLSACATTSTTATGTPATQAQIAYSQAQAAYLNAWSSYHTVWAALPDTDPRKAEWAQKYHPLFEQAANALIAWQADPTSQTDATTANAAIDKLTTLLLQLSIGGSK